MRYQEFKTVFRILIAPPPQAGKINVPMCHRIYLYVIHVPLCELEFPFTIKKSAKIGFLIECVNCGLNVSIQKIVWVRCHVIGPSLDNR